MLFKELSEIKTYLNFQNQTNIDLLQPHIERAEQKYIKRFLGKTLYGELHAYVNATDADENAKFEALLNLVRPPLAHFGVRDGVSQLNLILTNTGFATTQTNSLTPASKQRTDDLKAELSESAWDGIEVLLTFLEENKADYTSWVNGEGYTLAHRNLINSAAEFFDLVDIDTSRLLFTYLRAHMDNIEQLSFAPLISSELLTELKAQLKSGNASNANKTILPDLNRALANLALAAYIPEEKGETSSLLDKFGINEARRRQYSLTGNSYLANVVATIKATPDNYPAYKASALYVAPVEPYTNLAENPTFVFGG